MLLTMEGTACYLQSRYYDPVVKRFVSADAIATTGQGFLGENMFAYCNNNPVSASDPAGYAANWTNRVARQDGWPSTDPRSARTWPRIPAEYQNKLKLFDFYIPYGTHSAGVYFSGTPFGVWTFTGQLGFSVDGRGNFVVQYGLSGGMTTSVGSSGSFGIYRMDTNAPTVDHLTYDGASIGGSAVIPVSKIPLTAGADVNFISPPDEDKTYLGITTTAGLSVPGKAGAEAHATWGTTKLIEETRVNLYTLWDALFGGN